MGFAIDLGWLYLARGEARAAAEAMALSAASKLIGTDAATGNATAAMRFPVENTGGFANKYFFGGVVIGEGNGRLQSPMPAPEFYETLGGATGNSDTGIGDRAGSATARHVRIDIRAEAPLVFWGLLSIAQERKVTVAARAVAGLSAAVCTACGIEPVAIQPVDPEDTTNFGFSPNTRYTLGYSCTAGNQPTPLGGSDTRIPFILINRYNESATLFPDESSQAFRIGAGGLPGDANRLNSCLQIGTSGDVIWASAAPLGCNQPKSGTVTAFNCGLAARFDSALTTGCDTFASAADIITAYTSDSDITDLDDYAAYTGSTRRIITVAVVESIAATDGLTVMGFRQFLIQPDQGGINITPTDNNGRFIATYLGYPMPLKQGYNGTCGVSLGPGKVVLHQ